MDVMTRCKFYTPHMETIQRYIECLYSIEGCSCDGLLHVLTDDGNIQDHDIDWCLEYIEQEENRGREEYEISKLICQEMKKLSLPQRELLINFGPYSFICNEPHRCCECDILEEKTNYWDTDTIEVFGEMKPGTLIRLPDGNYGIIRVTDGKEIVSYDPLVNCHVEELS